jgi:hypothetical protein
LTSFSYAKAQDLLIFKQAEDSLVSIIRVMVEERDLPQKMKYNNHFKDFFQTVLEQDSSFHYPFDSLIHIGKLKSVDGFIRVSTWNVPTMNGMHKYYGFIQTRINEKTAVYPLCDERDKFEIPQLEVTSPEKWFGALYYYLHENNYSDKTYYTLLGVDLNNLFSRKRVIEVLTLDSDGKPILGHPIISVRNHMISRIVFEYSSQANMILKYDKAMNMIVFDHLSPMRNDFAENYQFYGPDLTFDALRFDQGKWVYTPNIDIRNPIREQIPIPIEAPVENPEPGFLYKPNRISNEANPAKKE